jgi:glycosyltransferase involved in cell wall biosynthesis
MTELSLVYYGYVFDASGYGHAARAYIHALHSAGVELSVVDLANHPRQVRDEVVESLIERKVTADFYLFHGIPPQWARLAFRLPNAIGMTVWETDVMPTQWRNVLNHMIDVWLPCDFNVTTFKSALETPVFKLPHPLLPLHLNGNLPPEPNDFLRVNQQDFVFYSIFEWQDRKSPDGLIESFLRAFPAESDVVLIIKANPGAANLAHETVQNARCRLACETRIDVRCAAWNEAQINALHARGNCYVSLHRGEGWCYPLFEAASRGIPVIATNYSGPLEYLNPEEHRLVQCELSLVRQPYIYYQPGMRWAEPDFKQATEVMRWVYENAEFAKRQAEKAAKRLRQTYSLDSVGLMARNRLLQLLQPIQPDKWKLIVRSEQAKGLSPRIPIPAEWYDEAYFETGLKSNWHGGYTWSLFSGLFKEIATFLSGVFAEANSYLDIGCAKGFMVRALRESGRECWGFDHSPWAIDHAEESIKPFLQRASVNDVDYNRQFDVLLALSIFESLTESQVLAFLSRARAWTRQGIFATITSFESEAQRLALCKDDRDGSHITMRTSEWWHKLFLRAGWRQDALHRVAERMCQAHDLPKKMGWHLYLYSPGQSNAHP